MARISGRHGRIAIADSSPEVVIGSASAWTLNRGRDYIDVTAFEDNNKQYVPGLQDVSGTITAFYNLDSGSPISGDSLALFQAAEGDTPVTLKLYPDSLNPQYFFTGLSYLDMSINVAVNGAVTLTGNFRGAGDWTGITG